MDGAQRWAPVGLVLHSLPLLPQPQVKPRLPCPPPWATRLPQSPVANVSHRMNQENSTQSLLITAFPRRIPSWPEGEEDKRGSGCCSATRLKGTRPYSSSSLTALLFSLDSWETTCAGSQPRGFESP